MEFLSSLSEMTAGEGLPIVILSGLQMLGALALIVGVLVVMDIVYKKKHPEWEKEQEKADEPEEKSESEDDNE